MKKCYFLTMALILGAMTMSAKTIYLNTGGSSLWNQAGAKFEAWAWGGTTDEAWYDFTLVDGETEIYKTEMPDDRTGMKILRKDPASASHAWESWNDSGDLTIPDDKNMYTITGWNAGDGNWENYETYVPEEAVTLVFNVTVPEGTENCYIVGSFNNWENFIQMTKVNDTQYSITLDNIIKSTLEYKYTHGANWDYVESQANGEDVGNRKYEENDVVAAWKDIATGIEEVGVDAGAAVYYNLQGVKVANPENGIFIKKQGSKATKVIL